MGRWMDKAKEIEAARKAEELSLPRTESIGGNGEEGNPSVKTTDTPTPKFAPGRQVLITDNENRVRAGAIQFADWIDMPLTAKGWWYLVIDAYGHLSETHESRLTDAGLDKRASR